MAQTFDIIDQLIKSGQMPQLIRAGAMSPTITEYYQIVEEFKALKKKYRHSSQQRIVQMICDNRNIGKTKVYAAINKMK